MINNIKLQPLKNGEYIQFITDTLHIVLNNNPDALMVKAQYDSLQSKLNSMEQIFKIRQSSPVTKEIETLDARRFKAIHGVRLQIHSLTYSNDPILNRHAKLLEAHLSLFGKGIARTNYQSKTTILRNIINDWMTKPELTEAITVLQLTPWQTEIDAANNAFSQALSTRNDELVTAPTKNLKTLRLEGNEAYYKLRDMINAFMMINEGAEPWAGTIAKINQNISNYMTLLNRRSSANNTDEGELSSE
ncbi:DUF6261 family protein [Pedobacter chitinilyticus]|uniref:Uncharacterized protein n=1 Tax=Pedobacter chitinilyticus TaxID=2233776 RepID=A0A3S3SRT5_9SPHI|nr:DUF6261 family protein [Pedobacter chitinilyticus]RWU04017.1 hypothetical protein DPV69_20285 [Pedobacter chitinilyticus]